MQAAKLWEDWRRLDKVPKSIGQGRYLTGSPLVLYPPVFLPIPPPFLPISLLLTPCGAVCLQSLLLCHRRLDRTERTHTDGNGHIRDNSPITVSRRYRRHWLSVKVRNRPYMSVVPPSIRLPAKAVFIIACNHFLQHCMAHKTSLPCRFLEFILMAHPLEKSRYFYYIIVRVSNNQPYKGESYE